MVDDLLADILGDIRDELVILLANPVEQVEGVVLAEMPVEGWRRAQTDEDAEDRDDDLALRLVSLLIVHFLQG